MNKIGSIALLSHFDKVLALSKFALLKCKNGENPVAWIPWVTSTVQFESANVLLFSFYQSIDLAWVDVQYIVWQL